MTYFQSEPIIKQSHSEPCDTVELIPEHFAKLSFQLSGQTVNQSPNAPLHLALAD